MPRGSARSRHPPPDPHRLTVGCRGSAPADLAALCGVDRLDAVFSTLEHPDYPQLASAGTEDDSAPLDDIMTPSLRQAVESARALVDKAKSLETDANEEDAEELRVMLTDLQAAIDRGSEKDIRAALREVEELVFYLEDA